jgi:hypothetical protein
MRNTLLVSWPDWCHSFWILQFLWHARSFLDWRKNNKIMLFLPPGIKCLSLLHHNVLFAPTPVLSFLTVWPCVSSGVLYGQSERYATVSLWYILYARDDWKQNQYWHMMEPLSWAEDSAQCCPVPVRKGRAVKHWQTLRVIRLTLGCYTAHWLTGCLLWGFSWVSYIPTCMCQEVRWSWLPPSKSVPTQHS